jgi:hypothetical protein
MKHWWSLVKLALIVGLVSVFIPSPQTLGAQGGRTWTVCAQGCDFTSIQQAIEAAQPGDIIKVEAGVYPENLVIPKDLSLRGIGPAQTVVKALDPNKPILYVPGDSRVRVSIYGMAFVGIPRPRSSSPLCSGPEHYGQCSVGIEVGGEAALTLEWVRIEDIQGGIWGYDGSTARISSTEIRNPGWYGLLLEGSADFTIVDSVINNTISEPGSDYTPERYGVLMRGDAHLSMVGTSITSNYNSVSIKLEGRAQATLKFVNIAGNRKGISLHDDARATILSSAIMEHPDGGIYAQDRAQFVLNYSLLALNGLGGSAAAVRVVNESKASISKTNFILNGAGIAAADSAQLILNYSRLLKNLWGVLLYVSPCFIDAPRQTKVTILGRDNEIPDQNQEDGNSLALCPPDYPWPPGFRK